MADTQQGWAKRTVAKTAKAGEAAKKKAPKGDAGGGDGAQPDEEIEDQSSSDAMDGGAMAKLGDFADKLKDAAPAIEDALTELALAEPLSEEEPADEVKADLAAAAASLPDDVKTGLDEKVKPLSYEECREVAEALADDGALKDADAFCSGVYWLSRMV